MYTKRSNDVVFTSFPADPSSTAVDLDPRHFASLPIDIPLPTVEMDTSAYYDLNLPIAYRKGKRFYTNILSLITFPMIILPHYLVSLLRLFLLFIYLSLIRKRS